MYIYNNDQGYTPVFGATAGEREAGCTRVGNGGRGGEDTARDGHWGGGRNVRELKEFREAHMKSILPDGSWPVRHVTGKSMDVRQTWRALSALLG
jgi:hypothetical protein